MAEFETSPFSKLVDIDGVREGYLITLYDLAPGLWFSPNDLPPSVIKLGQTCKTWTKPEHNWQGPEAVSILEEKDYWIARFVYHTSTPPLPRDLSRKKARQHNNRLDLSQTFNRDLVNVPLKDLPHRSSFPSTIDIYPHGNRIGTFLSKEGLKTLQPEDVVTLHNRIFVDHVNTQLFSLLARGRSQEIYDPNRLVIQLNFEDAAVFFDNRIDTRERKLHEDISYLRERLYQKEKELEHLMKQPSNADNERCKALVEELSEIAPGIN